MRFKTSTSLRARGVAEGCGRSLPPDGPDDATRRTGGATPVRLIFKKELQRRIGLTFPTVWRLMRAGLFPRARVIGGKTAWIEAEIDAFIAALPLRRYKE
jgi:predicted DNA-binding transcriptional regulator AlpA